MSDHHEDPTGTHKPQRITARTKARALIDALFGQRVEAAIAAMLARMGPPAPARVHHKRKIRRAMRGIAHPPSNGPRECARRRRQLERGQLAQHPSVPMSADDLWTRIRGYGIAEAGGKRLGYIVPGSLKLTFPALDSNIIGSEPQDRAA